MRLRAALVALAVLPLVAGCAGGSTGARKKDTPQKPTPSVSPCPAPTSTVPFAWPAEVPQDLPKPPGAIIEKVEKNATGVTVVRFSTDSTLRDGVLFIVREFPKLGYTLGRGDAESFEADAPFERGISRGLVRMLAQQQCRTLWLLAIGRSAGFAGAPFAPNYSPPPSAAPLPFG